MSFLAPAKALLSAAASLAATAMVVRSVACDLLPSELRSFISNGIHSMFSRFSPDITLIIEEMDDLDNNQIYEAAETYLSSKISPTIQRLKVSNPVTDKTFALTMEPNEPLTDVFRSVKFIWILVCRQLESHSFYNPRDLKSTLKSEFRSLELTFHKKHKEMVINTYIPYILQQAKSIKQETKALKIFTVDYQNIYGNIGDAWVGINLNHPATFDTLAMERVVKEFVMKDLERFVRRKEYYRRVGKAWKRGYLMHGPPGTGKSSLIAAMANYLKFDVYDLELTELQVNSELRRLLIGMANRSILVVEDIDCTAEFHDRRTRSRAASGNNNDTQLTLSGLLNFIDGLWSSCGDERIIVFTTNHKGKLDPALLRPGRMDVHIHMSYCTPCGFRQLASNYLGIKEHSLFEQIEEEMQKTQVTPAEVAEQLLKSRGIETSLKQLLDFMRKKKETQEMEAKKKQQLLDFLRKKKETQEMEAKKKEQEAEDEEEQQGKEIDDGSEEENFDSDDDNNEETSLEQFLDFMIKKIETQEMEA
ncbi:Protein HYPER-SENSITIVITY-RELATED 4 [Glycine soja]